MTYRPIKPPFAYYGGKTTLAERIVVLLPEHGHYVEPFAGSLAVLLAKAPARMETVNDLDDGLMTFWRVLRDRPDELIRGAALTPHSRAEYEACRQPTDDELETARRVWTLLSQGRAGSLRKTGWRHFADPAGSPSTSMPGYLRGYVERMAAVARRLAGVSLENRPALEVIAAYGSHPEVLVYVDPPYLRSARTSLGYRHEMPTADQHRQLAEALRACRAAVIISGYPSPLYDQLSGTGNGGQWATRTEVLWSNRPLRAHASLFDDLEATA
ncbi:MAG: DNA adenine methylase [Streptomycetales bacterium]